MSQNNRILVPVLVAVAILLVLFGVRPLYTEYMDQLSAQKTAELTRTARQTTLASLEELQKSFSSGSGTIELVTKVKKVTVPWNDAAIMSTVMLNDYTKGSTYASAPILLSSISLDRGKKLPSGLSLGNVTMTINASSVDTIVDFLTYLTTKVSYIFTLDSINLPISAPVQESNGTVTLQVSLGVYYYE